jgi:methylmalonyl-CoA/ethylmalonyl-CoA epimerase
MAPRLPEALVGLPIDHVAIAVPDLDAAGAWSALGLPRSGDDEDVPGQGVRVRALRAGEGLIELVAPTTPTSPVARFLATRGPGLHHVALRVPDVEEAVARLLAAGAAFVDPTPRPGRAGTRVVFLHPRWTGGTLVELVEHAHASRP